MTDMIINDNKTQKPIEHYVRLFASADPVEMSNRSTIEFNGRGFTGTLMGRSFFLSYPEMELRWEDGSEASPKLRILVSRLLLEGTVAPTHGKLLSYSQFEWGNVYATQFKGRCVNRLAAIYGSRQEELRRRCLSLGAEEKRQGDACFDIAYLPGMTVRLILWEGDEEFPASAQILFSDNFSAAFSAEDMAVVGDTVLDALAGKW